MVTSHQERLEVDGLLIGTISLDLNERVNLTSSERKKLLKQIARAAETHIARGMAE